MYIRVSIDESDRDDIETLLNMNDDESCTMHDVLPAEVVRTLRRLINQWDGIHKTILAVKGKGNYASSKEEKG